MIAQLKTWFDGRSRREKWLMLFMLALAGVTAVWVIVLPIDEALSAARQRNADAAIRLAQVRGQIDAVRALRRARSDTPPLPLDVVVRQSASSAGFALDSVVPDGAKLRVRVGAARGGALLAWLGDLEGQGVLVDRIDVSDAGNHNVAADISFRMTAP